MYQKFTYSFVWNFKKMLIFNWKFSTLLGMWVDILINFGVIIPLATKLLNYAKIFGFQNLLLSHIYKGFELLK